MSAAIDSLRERYETAELSPVDIVEQHLAAAETLGGELNAIAAVLRDTATLAAEQSARRYREGRALSRLDGVPITVKDLMHIEGASTGCGSLAYSDVKQVRDADMVTQLKLAGAIIIAKTNLLEFAFGLVHPKVGPAHNPWDPRLSIGGSSSGSAAAVAAGIGYVSVGTDTAGSIRNPAALGGVVGFKPSYGYYSAEGLVPLSPSLDHLGWLGLSTSDIATCFVALGGHFQGTSTTYRPVVSTANLPYTSPAVAELVGRLLENLAFTIIRARPVEFDWEMANAAAITIISAEAYAVHRNGLGERWPNYSVETRVRLLAGASISAGEYMRARQVREALCRAWERATQGIDFVVLPTLPSPATTEAEARVEDLSDATLYTSPFALLGLPAISVPAGLTPEGRPVGLQIVGRPGRDGDLLAFAEHVERVRGDWPHPPYYSGLL